jgi:eukaryotic-like serine/threonine-protein kinase
MATVYAATHRNRKRFAVKMLHTEYSVRSDVRSRFVREGYVANSVPHPGVVSVLDDDVDETGAAFLVMELLDGVTVDALYTCGGPIPVREALGIIHQLLEVLEAAHEKFVVHRDIKPANLFVLRDGQLKVLDFGIARLRDSDPGLKSTRNGVLLGTPAFMAPEQALAMPENVDARTDVWAAGATLFTMLSACFVHSGDNARQIMIRAATDPARSIESIMPDLPASVAAIVSRALAFERAQRWQSAAEMRDAVLETFSELFGSAPVRADVAALVERTSAAFGAQPTQLQPLTDPQKVVAGRCSSQPPPAVAPQAPARPLETTMSTPVAVLGQAAPRRTRWFLRALLAGVAVLGIGGVLTLARPGPRSSSLPPAAVVSTTQAARADAAPSRASTTTPEATAKVASAAPTRAAVSDSSPRPASSSARARKTPRSAPSSALAPRAAAPPAPSAMTDDPLTLRLQ